MTQRKELYVTIMGAMIVGAAISLWRFGYHRNPLDLCIVALCLTVMLLVECIRIQFESLSRCYEERDQLQYIGRFINRRERTGPWWQ